MLGAAFAAGARPQLSVGGTPPFRAWRSGVGKVRKCGSLTIAELAASHAHMAGQGRALMPSIDQEIMPLGFACNRLIDRSIQEVIACRSPQRIAEICGVVLAKAHVKCAGASNAYTVARFTEIVSKRGNETQPATGFFHAHVARRPSRAVVDFVER